MSRLSSTINNIVFCTVLTISAALSVHASTTVTMNQVGDMVTWQISGNTYTIDKANLTVTGTDHTAATPSGCTSLPLLCSSTFNSGSLNFTTDGLDPGTYNWEIEIIPLLDDVTCASPDDVREAQGGFQGLSGNAGVPLFEENYLNCLRAAGLLPSDDQELSAAGSFNIESNGALIVPIDPNPGTPDNIPPLAICMDVVIEGSGKSCSVTANVDNGSNDPDGSLVSVVQFPEGPYGLGVTNVTLSVTDDTGAIDSCSATVTVTDSLAPAIQCPADNTMTPPSAPATFVATANDTCSTPFTQVASYECYRFNPHGKRIDTSDSCVVTMSNNSITVIETSGVNSFVDWTIEASDSVGNSSSETCTVEVLHPQHP